MSGQIVAYVRVSSTDQNPERQLAAVGDIEETFTDRVSGKSRGNRPQLTELLRHVRRGDTVRVASMDRLARSVVDLAQIVQELNAKGVKVGRSGSVPSGSLKLTRWSRLASRSRRSRGISDVHGGCSTTLWNRGALTSRVNKPPRERVRE